MLERFVLAAATTKRTPSCEPACEERTIDGYFSNHFYHTAVRLTLASRDLFLVALVHEEILPVKNDGRFRRKYWKHRV